MSNLFVNQRTTLTDIELIIFDKDGTLIDIHHYWSSMIKIRASEIVNRWFSTINVLQHERNLIELMGVDLNTNRLKPEGPVGVKPRHHIVSLVAGYICQHAQPVKESNVEQLFQFVDKLTEQNLLPLLRLLPGARSLLFELNRLNIPMVIASTDITSRVVKAMQTLELDTLFAYILGGDLVKNTKPSPDLAELAIKRTGVNHRKVAVIGDHPVDILMGESAGVGVNIGTLNGISNEKSFSPYNCQIIKDLQAIKVQ